MVGMLWRRRNQGSAAPAEAREVRLCAYEYAHVCSNDTGVTELVVGPLCRPLLSSESLVRPPVAFHVVPPAHYAVVCNPYERTLRSGTAAVDAEVSASPHSDLFAGASPPWEAPHLCAVRDRSGQVRCRLGHEELRYWRDGVCIVLGGEGGCSYEWPCPDGGRVLPAFPLYPDEELVAVRAMEVIPPRQIAILHVLADYAVGHAPAPPRTVGERYVLQGPATYYPHPCEEVVDRAAVRVVPPGTGLHCRARVSVTLAGESAPRPAGSEWLHVEPGDYVPVPGVEVVRAARVVSLGQDGAAHVEVQKIYRDPRPFAAGVERRAGDVFMVTADDCAQQLLLLHPYDKLIARVTRLHMTERQYCVVARPVQPTATALPAEKPSRLAAQPDTPAASRRYRDRRVLTGTSFFLRPGEVLLVPPRPAHTLAADEALLVQAVGDFTDTTTAAVPTARVYGDRWLVRGPQVYIPSPHVAILQDPRTHADVRRRVLLTDGEGLYVRHVPSGVVRLIAGPCSYMLEAEEEMWGKPLPPHVQRHVGTRPEAGALRASPPTPAPMADGGEGGVSSSSGGGGLVHGVSYHIPNRSVTQLFNYRTQQTRTVFGPDRVLLEPDEDFTVVSLSGSPWDPARPNTCLPKEPGRITALYLFLGPSNMSDVVEVETSDHARLSLQLCYDWCFDCPHGDAAAANECFAVNDFVGNTCAFIASRVRAAVASVSFEQFHKRSAQVLRTAVFGGDDAAGGGPASTLRFPANRLVVSSVDIQEMRVLDERTLRGLQRSAKMAIEISTHTQGVRAQQVATTRAQEARGILDRRRMNDQVANEEQRKVLLETESEVLSIVSSSKSTALAKAMSLAATIETNAAVTAARVRAERETVVHMALAEGQRQRRLALATHEARMEAEGGRYQRELETIQLDLMGAIVAALGPETIEEMARAGPELQATLLSSLGLEGYLVTDGSTPLNLFQTAAGLTGGGVVGSRPTVKSAPAGAVAVATPAE